uniref:Uncharacterized protein n=1 Tax=Lactuca sativa TaxID=4236 RepID=A0A9R1WK04_LACSA|nr:hypothetical protein LSAT_V11C100045590 [Lactuca sativa]
MSSNGNEPDEDANACRIDDDLYMSAVRDMITGDITPWSSAIILGPQSFSSTLLHNPMFRPFPKVEPTCEPKEELVDTAIESAFVVHQEASHEGAPSLPILLLAGGDPAEGSVHVPPAASPVYVPERGITRESFLSQQTVGSYMVATASRLHQGNSSFDELIQIRAERDELRAKMLAL